MDHTVEIIASREQSTMVNTWMEYLCLATTATGRWRLFTGRYEALAELASYYNEETEEHELPDVIKGKPVQGSDEDYVVGGELECFEDEEVVEFDSLDEPQVAVWLDGSRWSALATLNDVRAKLISSQTACF